MARLLMTLSVFFVLVSTSLAPWWSSLAEAACTGSSPTWSATIDEASINTCISNASPGDTINVAAGSASWGGNGLQIAKANISVIGAGIGSSIVTGAGAACIEADGVRLSGFTFNTSASASACGLGVLVILGAQDVRIDHIKIDHPNWSSPLGCVWAIGLTDGSKESTGVIDNSTLINCRVLVWGEFVDTDGRYNWSRGNARGTGKAWFVEDVDYTIEPGSPGPGLTCNDSGRVLCNFTDNNHGGAMVVRYNKVHNSYFEIHPTFDWNDSRGGKLAEFYHNTVDQVASFQGGFSRPFFFQGAGTGVAFNNVITGTWSDPDFSYDYLGRAGPCNSATNNAQDQNLLSSPDMGWPCLDQLGVGYEETVMTTSTNVGQVLQPWYTFLNTVNGSEVTWQPNAGGLGNIYRNNRDFYQYDPGFDGTSGVGVGPIADIPATCNPDPTGDYTSAGISPGGVAYWATDVGEWNSKQNGPDGQLCVCTAPNTWTVGYIPYPYPHPLAGGASSSTPASCAAGGDTIPPAPPQNLQVN